MKALVLDKYLELNYRDFSKPEIDDDEVLIQVKACGICGSDVHGLVTVDQAEATRKKIGDLANFDNFSPTTSEKNFRNVYNTLKEEIGTSISKEVPEFKASLDEAKSKFKQVKELENRAFFKSIKSFAEKKQFDKIINTFASPSASTADIRDAYGFLGEAAELKIQKSMMSDIIHKAKGASGEFTASGFSKQFKSLGDEKLRALFSKEQLRQLKDLNTLNVALSKSQKVAGGSQTALIQGFSNFFRAGAAISSSGVSLLSEYGISKFFRTQKGKDLLTKFGNKELSEIKALIKRIDKLEGKVN